jgi:hypothetical protein
MDIKLPVWVLRRLVRKNPWLLSTSGVVSRSITIDLFFGEVTVWGSWQLLDEDRERLIKERDQGLLTSDEARPPDP